MNLLEILLLLEHLRSDQEKAEESPRLLTWKPAEEMQDA